MLASAGLQTMVGDDFPTGLIIQIVNEASLDHFLRGVTNEGITLNWALWLSINYQSLAVAGYVHRSFKATYTNCIQL